MTADQTALLAQLAGLIGTSPHNLVSRAERSRVLSHHVAEAVLVGEAVSPEGRWMDLGTGGGLPGLVLAVSFPHVRWVLVDATRKKVEAVRSFAEVLGLSNVEACWGRAEDLGRTPELRESFDGVVARALAPAAVAAELARPFLRPSGELVLIKGPTIAQELEGHGETWARLRLQPAAIEPLARASRPTTLLRMRPVGSCPRDLPRRGRTPRAEQHRR